MTKNVFTRNLVTGKLFFGLLVFVGSVLSAKAVSASEDFPGRDRFTHAPVIDTAALADKIAAGKVVVIDVRSPLEYQTLRIKGSINLPLGSKRFGQLVKALSTKSKRSLVFYCNGHTCFKSYKAVTRAQAAGVKDLYSYDSGVFDWARAHPDQAELLGRSPVDPDKLLSKREFKQRCLAPEVFAKRISKETAVLDVRDGIQSQGLSLFPGRQRNIPLAKKDKLMKKIARAVAQGKELLIYDNVGKQVRWLQYHLEDLGIEDYYFMCGGAKAYYKYLGQG